MISGAKALFFAHEAFVATQRKFSFADESVRCRSELARNLAFVSRGQANGQEKTRTAKKKREQPRKTKNRQETTITPAISKLISVHHDENTLVECRSVNASRSLREHPTTSESLRELPKTSEGLRGSTNGFRQRMAFVNEWHSSTSEKIRSLE